MRRLKNHLIGVDQGSATLFSDFENSGTMWTGSGQRECRKQVNYKEKFKSVPVVHLSLSMWDQHSESNQRGELNTQNVSESGFDIVFTTWGDTKIARARASWLAIGELTDDDEWNID